MKIPDDITEPLLRELLAKTLDEFFNECMLSEEDSVYTSLSELAYEMIDDLTVIAKVADRFLKDEDEKPQKPTSISICDND